MKLSDAAVLGAATWERVCHAVEEENDSQGCFLQLALRAAGVSEDLIRGSLACAKQTAKVWPWTQREQPHNHWTLARMIWEKNDTGVPFEEILAYVRQHEPAEKAEESTALQSLGAFGPQPGVECGQQPATAQDALEKLRENDYDFSAGTR